MAAAARRARRLERATERHRAGAFDAARALYQALLAEAPGDAVALFRSGLLELQQGHPEAALTLIEGAVAAAPEDPRHHFGLGQALQAMRRWEAAAVAYRRSLQAAPDSPDALFALGLTLQSLGDGAAAIEAYREAVRLRPAFADAHNNLGVALMNLERLEEAIEALRRATEQDPGSASHAVNLGIALCRRRDFPAAEAMLRRATVRHPGHAESAFNLGNALHGLGRMTEAVDQYRRALALRPDYADACNNLGNAYKELGEFGQALAAYEDALRVQPDFAAASNNAACLLRTLGRIGEAEAMLRRGLLRHPDNAVLHNSLGSVLKDAGELDTAIECFRASLALDPGAAATHSNLAYSLSFQSPEPWPILQECLRWDARFAAGLVGAARPTERAARLRVGYVSPDFRDHCQSLFTIPLLEHHDHADFEIFCYSSVERPDSLTRRIAGHADVWRDVRRLDDVALAAMIRADGIHILVDLTMHMANGRPLVFARKPAPLQVAWLAYPGTTGMAAMDYRLSDLRLDPEGWDSHYRERSLRLPDSFWCYDPLGGPPVNELPADARGRLTFGCLNNPCKLTDRTLVLWGAVLRALPESRLVLMIPGEYGGRMLQRLAAQGIDAERVSLEPFRPRADYLRTYHDIDIGLDTFPYNGHTTSLDALWMGVPVVTRAGATCVGRAGLSQLFHVDLPDLAAHSDEDFVSAALKLARDLGRLRQLRRELRPRLERSALMDGARFARNMEAAYQQIWRRYCAAGNSVAAGAGP